MLNNRKRFLYVGAFEMPDKNAAAHRVLSVARILSHLGYEVVFLDVTDEKEDYTLSPVHMEAGYPVHSRKRPEGTQKWAKHVLNPLHVEEVLEKYTDWAGVIAYNYPAMALHKLRKICRARNIKLFADCTEWYRYGFTGTLREIALEIDTFFRMRIVQKKIDGLIVISKYLEEYYKDTLPVVVIPPLVDKMQKKWMNDKKDCAENVVTLSYAGDPGRTKDKLDTLVHAVCNCSKDNVKLNIVGITKKLYLEYYPADQELLSTDNANNRVTFWGIVPHAKALQIVKDSSYTVFYRNINRVSMAGFPTKFVESISCGVPVITNQTSDLKNYLGNNKNGIMLSTERFEEELTELLENLTQGSGETCETEEDRFDYRNYVDMFNAWLAEIH